MLGGASPRRRGEPEMVSIGISFGPPEWEKWQEENRKGGFDYFYWNIPNLAPNVGAGDLLWVAVGGRWKGFFVVQAVVSRQVRFQPSTWVSVDAGDRSYFQGFTYEVPKRPP